MDIIKINPDSPTLPSSRTVVLCGGEGWACKALYHEGAFQQWDDDLGRDSVERLRKVVNPTWWADWTNNVEVPK